MKHTGEPALLLLLLIAAAGCANEPAPPAAPVEPPGREVLREVQSEAGLSFVHRHGGAGDKWMVETMGSGGGFLDFDGDGWQDLYLVQSGPLPGARDRSEGANRLFRNRGDGTFEDVTERSGAGDTGYGMGFAAADYDNDGDIDLHVTNYGPNRLYRNEGDGTFTDVTEQAGVGDDRWGTSAAFADYDRDGDVDLYVVNYVDWSPVTDIRCGPAHIRAYCSPDVYPGASDVLYRNNGDGSFSDVTREAGLLYDSPDEAKGLGVVWTDDDGDGDLDIYVANDGTPNFLFRNKGDGTFVDVALEAGAAFNDDGKTEAGMGVDAADYDGDGDPDLYVTHLQGETNTLYRNTGDGFYEDVTVQTGLGVVSLKKVGFGTGFFDYDNDGRLDLFVANGHILAAIEEISPDSGFLYRQANQLFESDGAGGYTDISERAGRHFENRRVSRGAALGDVDNDGDLDVLVTNNNEDAVLLENEIGQERDWIGFVLVGRGSNRSAIGARVGLETGGRTRWLAVKSGGSYLSQNDLRLVFGIDAEPGAAWVRWPDGRRVDLDVGVLDRNAYNLVEEPE